MAALHRNCASYEAIDPAVASDFDKPALQKLVKEAIADIGTLSDMAVELLGALKAAEAFVATFEGDQAQDGIDALLEMIRAPIAKAKEVL